MSFLCVRLSFWEFQTEVGVCCTASSCPGCMQIALEISCPVCTAPMQTHVGSEVGRAATESIARAQPRLLHCTLRSLTWKNVYMCEPCVLDSRQKVSRIIGTGAFPVRCYVGRKQKCPSEPTLCLHKTASVNELFFPVSHG